MADTRERIYHFVRDRLLEGAPPSLREVQRAVGLKAVESVRAHLEVLVAEGRLEKKPGKARGYSLPRGQRPRVTSVPVLGRVQAGGLTTAVEDLEGYLAVEAGADEELFALRVRGDSMVGAGILPGDLVVVRRQSTARSGEIVVALVEDEATVKRLRLKAGQVELVPENEAFEVIAPPPDQLRILGRVIEVRRRL